MIYRLIAALFARRSPASTAGAEPDMLGFAGAAGNAFAFLDEFGFSPEQATSEFVRFRKNDLIAEIYHEKRSYELGLAIDKAGHRYSLSEIIRATDPDTAKQYRDFAATTPQAVVNGLSYLSELAVRFARPALEDDANFFALLAERQEAWGHEHALDVLERQVRPRAEDAFRRASYAEAAELYQQIRPRLTPAESKKLAFAKQKSNGEH